MNCLSFCDISTSFTFSSAAYARAFDHDAAGCGASVVAPAVKIERASPPVESRDSVDCHSTGSSAGAMPSQQSVPSAMLEKSYPGGNHVDNMNTREVVASRKRCKFYGGFPAKTKVVHCSLVATLQTNQRQLQLTRIQTYGFKRSLKLTATGIANYYYTPCVKHTNFIFTLKLKIYIIFIHITL